MSLKTVAIDLGIRSYDISIGSDLLSSIEDFLPFDARGKKIFLITDDNVDPYAKGLQKKLLESGAGLCKVLTLPHGEKTKSYEYLHKVHDWLLENNVHRNSIIFAVGGGVIGDLAGFSASTILRGVPFVQVPTSLLAQVDSSVGGKNGINTKFGKNLVGNFYQPISVIADIDVFKTLPKRELLAGYAEVVKYGLIADKQFFNWLEGHAKDIISLNNDAISYAVEVSCRAKAKIVELDELESGARALLNLGHTFGHALEAAAGYDGSLLHGEGVSIGTVMAFDLSVSMGLCPPEDAKMVRAHFKNIGLPVHAGNINANINDLMKTMQRDKKALDNKMIFILLNSIGDAFITDSVPENMVVGILEKSLAECG